MAQRIITGDTVVVIAGSCKGQVGEVISVSGQRAVLKDVNLQMKHIKSKRDEPGQRIYKPGSIHISNLMHRDENAKRSRVGFKYEEHDGKRKKVLVLKTTGKELRKI